MITPLALVFSDLHINEWSKFNQDNERTLNHFKVLSILQDEVLKASIECPLIFCGDLFHKSESITPSLLDLTIKFFRDRLVTPVLAISGNHDIFHVSKVGTQPLSWSSILAGIFPNKWINVDYSTFKVKGHKVLIHGIPYVDHNIGINEYISDLELDKKYKHILLLHTDYPGARDTDGREVGSVENLNLNLLNKFDLVLCGHIHKPQRLSKKVYMIGAPLQQRRTDRDCKLGYWTIYSDLTIKFHELTGFPKFIDVSSKDEILDDGNYYTVISQPESSKIAVPEHKITKQLTKTALAKQYLKAKGILDNKKEKLLINLLKKTDR